MESAGAIRLSLGLATNFADVYRCVQFVRAFADHEHAGQELPPRPSRC
jgi:hypothetical protein